MIATSVIFTANNKGTLTVGMMDGVDSAIQMIFDAFENTSLHDQAVLHAKERAAQSYSGAQKERALEIIEQLGRMMDRDYWSAPTPYIFSSTIPARNG